MKNLVRTAVIYKPVAVRASKLYFLCTDMSKLNHMYQFTHQWFFDVFLNQLKLTDISD